MGLLLARAVYKGLAARHGLEATGLLPEEPPLGELDLPAPELALPAGGVGLAANSDSAEEVRPTTHIVGLAEASVAGLAVLEVVCGWDRVVLMDSIQTPGGRPGQLHRFNLADLQDTVRTASPHDLNLASALEFGRRQGYGVPSEVVIYAVEAAEVLRLHMGLSQSVAAALPGAVQRIFEEQFP